MDGIVLQLQAEAMGDSIDIEMLLRKAFLVARKLKLKEFEDWISNELNGYKEKIPDYRIISGQIKAWNPYRGWIPVVMDEELADVASKKTINSPISTLSEAYNDSDGSVRMTIHGALTDFLNENINGYPTEYCFMTSRAELHKIISAVRNKILEWAILLEENGIVGEGVSFTNYEKKVAANSTIINNYTNNFYAKVDNTKIKQGNNYEK